MATYCISVRNELKVHVLPFNLHLLHGFLQTKLLTGSTAYLIKPKGNQNISTFSTTSFKWFTICSITRILLEISLHIHDKKRIKPAPWNGDILHAPMLNNKLILTFLWTYEGCIPACYRGMLMVQVWCQSLQLHSSAKNIQRSHKIPQPGKITTLLRHFCARFYLNCQRWSDFWGIKLMKAMLVFHSLFCIVIETTNSF